MSYSAVRKRRRQRLAIIGAVALVLVGLVVVQYVRVKNKPAAPTAQVNDERRAAGLAAFAAGDNDEAIAQLTDYVDDNPKDDEALYSLAVAHRRQASLGTHHLVAAANHYRAALNANPQRLEVTRGLLELLIDSPAGVEQEILKLADRLAGDAENDELALRARVFALRGLERIDDATEAADGFLAAYPLDVAMHRRALDLLKAQGNPASMLLERTETLRGDHPGEPQPMLVEAYARILDDDREAAIGWLERAGQPSPPNADFVAQTVKVMDQAEQYAQVPGYLSRVAQIDPALVDFEELARRLFESGLVLEAHEAALQVKDPSLALRSLDVIALLRLGRDQQVAEGIAQLRALSGKTAAATAAWLEVCVSKNPKSDQIIQAGRAAIEAGVRNPYLDLMLAEAYETAGQLTSAQDLYLTALARRPSWAAPCLKLAELTLQQGDAANASRYALAAVRRQPESLSARVRLAETLGSEPGRLDRRQTRELFTLIDQIQGVVPGEPRTLELKINLLSQTGDRVGANQAARDAITLDPPLGEEALLSLIDTTRRNGLETEQELQQAYIQRFGQTLEITMLKAAQLADLGDAETALAAYDAATPPGNPINWRVNRALLLERLGRPEAAAAWIAVGDGLPDNILVQQNALESLSAWNDRPFIDRTIKRLRKLTGDEATIWRVQRARWLLSGENPKANAAEVETLLADVTLSSTALRMRALAQRLGGNETRAIDLLQEAIFVSPDDVDAALDLAGLKQAVGEEQAALDLLQSAAAKPGLSDGQLRTATALLLSLNQPTRAVTMLERLIQNGRADARDLLMLARLYRQTQQTSKAVGLVEKLLKTPAPETIALAADLYASQGQLDRARAVLGRLDELNIPAEDAANIRAAFLVEHGEPEQAEAAFVAATEAAPADAEAWRRLIAYQLRSQKPTEAIASARRGLRALPSDGGLLALVANAGPIERLSADAGAASFALTLLRDDDNRRVAADVLNLLDRNAAQPDRMKLADDLQKTADANPDFETLQVVTVTAQLAAGRYQAALDRANGLVDAFPESVRAARLTAEAWASIGRWREALLAAERWAQRGPNDRAEADTLIARTHRQLGRAGQAVATLEPYRGQIESQPLLRPEMTKQWALALAGNGQSRDARAILEPRLGEGLTWRMAMLDAAVLSVAATRQAGQWLESVQAAIPDDSWDERAALAQAWWTLGQRDSFGPYLDRGREQAKALSQIPAASAELWYFLGTIGEADGDLGVAEKAYRRAIELDPETIFARNNLAMVLAEYGGDLNEAVGLAKRVVESRPEDPNFHDTLAFVLLQAGRLDEAEEAIRVAMELDPSNSEWRVRLEEINARRTNVNAAGVE